MLAHEPLLQLLEPSLRAMMDKVNQSRSRITTAERRIVEAIRARDVDAARTWMARHIRDFSKGYEIAGIDLQSTTRRLKQRPTALLACCALLSAAGRRNTRTISSLAHVRSSRSDASDVNAMCGVIITLG